jgi:hypothetical protein
MINGESAPESPNPTRTAERVQQTPPNVAIVPGGEAEIIRELKHQFVLFFACTRAMATTMHVSTHLLSFIKIFTSSSLFVPLAFALLLSAPSYAEKTSLRPEYASGAPTSQISEKSQNIYDTQKPAATSTSGSKSPQTPRPDQRAKDANSTARQEATYTGLLVIVAICTVIVTVVTARFQYRAASSAAEASRKSADAAIATTTAYLHVMRLWLEGNEGRGKDIMDGAVGVADPTLHYGFTNYGKTPAFLLEMCWESVIALRLPPIATYKNCGEVGEEFFVIAAETDINHAFPWSHLFGRYLTEDDFAPIRRMEQRLYVYGFFRYRDVFERCWRVGFAYHFDSKGQAHVVAPDIAPGYWYRQLET